MESRAAPALAPAALPPRLLSLALNDSRSVRAVKGSLRRFAPWTAGGPIRRDGCL